MKVGGFTCHALLGLNKKHPLLGLRPGGGVFSTSPFPVVTAPDESFPALASNYPTC